MSSLEDEISLKHNDNAASRKELLVFFITGNPGLIGYYRAFLTLCYDALRAKYPDHALHVYGTSLAGFEVSIHSSEGRHGSPFRAGPGPWDLEQQIRHIDAALAAQSTASTRVVLVGHSVGSYILLEVLRRRKSRVSAAGGSSGGGGGGGGDDGERRGEDGTVIGGICLFPTVTHIARSPSGKRFSLISSIPYFAPLAGIFVNVLFSWVPVSALQRLVTIVTGFPKEAAEVTTAFLKSRGGVRQALYLAKHEMQTITADKWDDELWGIARADDETNMHTQTQKTKLFFLFGTDDHWVADETRDELITGRGTPLEGGGKDTPVMEIDEGGIPHGFCIKHSEPVSRKVVEYVDEAVGLYWQ